jgi:rifampicin phosphotransferase
MNTHYVLPLADEMADIQRVGGKGQSLAKMIRAGLPVPDGFHVTTDAYRAFVAANNLQARILAALAGADADSPVAVEATSAAIYAYFADGVLPPDVKDAVSEAYGILSQGNPSGVPVAVRSSATAEDLPEASFAGQQVTFLNVCCEQAVLAAVQQCWASLWTARAIAYRMKQGVDPESIALAVVIQKMVLADSAGVLFTANPLNGKRDEMVINAAWGLGEAVVGGLVTPDTIIVEKTSRRIKQFDTAEKTVMTVATSGGTTETLVEGTRRKAQVLNSDQVSELAQLGQRIETFYGCPQDIEWCLVKDRFAIVQSRPITRLPEEEAPIPVEWRLPKGSYAAMRNNIVELMVEPLSPLFATLGLSAINASLNRFMTESFDMGGIMPPEIIITVNQYAYNNGSISAKSMARVTFGAGRILRRMFNGAVERWTETGRPHYHMVVESWRAEDWRTLSTWALIDAARQFTEAAIEAYATLVSGVIPAAWITEARFTHLYNRLIRRRGDPTAATFLLGFDSVPILSDRSLYDLATWTLRDVELAQSLKQLSSMELAAYVKNGTCPTSIAREAWEAWLAQFKQHLLRFGYTIYDLDFIHPVPADDPAPVLESFKLYLCGQGANPHERQQAMIYQREQATMMIRARLRRARLRWFKRYLASAQKYAPLREDGLSEIGLAYPLIRQMLLEVGRRFAGQGAIKDAGDIFWLAEDEVRDIAKRLDAKRTVDSLADGVRRRKAEHKAALRANPPVALPQMKVFGFDLMSIKQKRSRTKKGVLVQGVAASPGVITGTARVIHGPEDFKQMHHGDILIAPITTPAWTPLFSLAAAVVTDIGGPLSHGSIVAREYGIPAVLGTGAATRRILSGQVVTVDGSAGTVVLKREETLNKKGSGRK